MQTNQNYLELLETATKEPGKLLEAYSVFHNYSIGNQLLAMLQSGEGKEGPINTYKGWQALGRQVRKGEKAIVLCMPVTIKKDADEGADPETFTKFIYRRNWFYLSQTDGAEYVAPAVPGFDLEKALAALEIEKIPFTLSNGNVQGYAQGRKIAVNPLAQMPFKTAIYEIAHIVHGHTGNTVHDTAELPRDIKEVEAEGTAYLVCAALGLPGLEYPRGYIQSFLGGKELTEKTARRIMAAADKILKAGAAAAG